MSFITWLELSVLSLPIICLHEILNTNSCLSDDPTKLPASNTRFGFESTGKKYSKRYWSDTNFKAIKGLELIAQKAGRNLTHFALAWILNNKIVTSVICGCSSTEQLRQNLGAIDMRLTAEELASCDEIWQMLSPPRFSYGR
ncbi:MAG: aldo/keto reductase [Deltaproteobacteria bacterium]